MYLFTNSKNFPLSLSVLPLSFIYPLWASVSSVTSAPSGFQSSWCLHTTILRSLCLQSSIISSAWLPLPDSHSLYLNISPCPLLFCTHFCLSSALVGLELTLYPALLLFLVHHHVSLFPFPSYCDLLAKCFTLGYFLWLMYMPLSVKDSLIKDLSTILTISGSRKRVIHFYDFWIQKSSKWSTDPISHERLLKFNKQLKLLHLVTSRDICMKKGSRVTKII